MSGTVGPEPIELPNPGPFIPQHDPPGQDLPPGGGGPGIHVPPVGPEPGLPDPPAI
jgi:hypothetical protein